MQLLKIQRNTILINHKYYSVLYCLKLKMKPIEKKTFSQQQIRSEKKFFNK